MTAQIWIVIVIGLAATVEDLIHRQISNWICAAAFLAGLSLHVASEGWHGCLTATLGTVAGFGVFLIFYLLGGMGGGDVKLMAGFGAILGVSRLIAAALWTAACGGIFAALAIAFHALRGWLRKPVLNGDSRAVAPAKRLQSIPYAPAIAAGVWLSLVPKT